MATLTETVKIFDPAVNSPATGLGLLAYNQLPFTPLYALPFTPSPSGFVYYRNVPNLLTNTSQTAGSLALNTNGSVFNGMNGYASPIPIPNLPPIAQFSATANTGYAGFTNYTVDLSNPNAVSLKPVSTAFPILDPNQGFTLEFNLAVLAGQSNPARAGFSLLVVSNDLSKAIELGFKEEGVNSDRIFAQGPNLNTESEDTTGKVLEISSTKTYQLKVKDNTYTLLANGATLLTGSMRDYVFNPAQSNPPFPDTVNPYETKNLIFLGDNTDQAYAQFTLGAISVLPYQLDPADPEPTGEPKVSLTDNGLLKVEQNSEDTTAFFETVRSQAKVPMTLSYFKTDDAQGTIDGLAPGAAGYQEAALKRALTVFSTPDQFDFSDLDFARTLGISTEGYYSFLLSERGKVFLGNTPTNGKLPLTLQENSGTFSLRWNTDSNASTDEWIFNLRVGNNAKPTGSNLQAKTGSEVFDLRDFSTPVTGTATIYREAAYNSGVGFYVVENEQGQVRDEFGNLLNPGDSGYTRAAVRQWTNQASLAGTNQQTITSTFQLQGGSIWAPFIVVQGNIGQLLDGNASNDPAVYFPYLGANSDKTDHIRLLGNNTFGFEDMPNGGDFDFDDVVIQVTFS
ncbi:MAG TPA: DUF4114 domain-containing protein [Leptolyngbyaceae cyanobacterium]